MARASEQAAPGARPLRRTDTVQEIYNENPTRAATTFCIRTDAGRILRVMAVYGEPGRLSRGDTVSVTGRYSGSSFNATGVSILRDR